MLNDDFLSIRQLWGQLNTEQASTPTTQIWCTPLILPTGGVLVLGDDTTTTLGAKATFKLPCDSTERVLSPDASANSTVIGLREPFYASISPQIFALATATVISYILVILIFITPRTFYVGGPGGGAGFLSRRGLSYGSRSIVGVGRRPLLQKIATVTVAISLTIATSDTFNVAKDQYDRGYISSSALVENVVNSLEIRIVRIISDSFLWLAQVQTLIRLFPRHKEKVAIKWLGFALVTCDIVFSILDSFVSDNPGNRPRSFTDAIPALNYLFELAISLIYASCVIYYSLSKRRFAFWHPRMRNVCLVALISFISVIIPVVFFVIDVSLPELASWGEYIRWVGAAAASVVVWEWVERIEALERDERKEGILGREIFDGDEMLDSNHSEDGDWTNDRSRVNSNGDIEKDASFGIRTTVSRVRAKLPLRRRRKRAAPLELDSGITATANQTEGFTSATQQITVPQPAVSPPGRSDTASAASTVYAVRYHNLTSPSPVTQNAAQDPNPPTRDPNIYVSRDSSSMSASVAKDKEEAQANASAPSHKLGRQFWPNVQNPFKRRKAEPPAEVAGAQLASGIRRSPIDGTLHIRGRLGAFAAAQRDRFARNGPVESPPLPVMIIPAPKNNERTWSPDELRNASTDPHAPQEADGRHQGSQQQSVSAAERQDVVVIPAPSGGRTWSPQDATGSGQRQDTGSQGHGNVSSSASHSSPHTLPAGERAEPVSPHNAGGGHRSTAPTTRSAEGGTPSYAVAPRTVQARRSTDPRPTNVWQSGEPPRREDQSQPGPSSAPDEHTSSVPDSIGPLSSPGPLAPSSPSPQAVQSQRQEPARASRSQHADLVNEHSAPLASNPTGGVQQPPTDAANTSDSRTTGGTT